MFGEYNDKRLAKDDLYYSIKNEIESKVKVAKKKKGRKDKKDGGPDAKVLPEIP